MKYTHEIMTSERRPRTREKSDCSYTSLNQRPLGDIGGHYLVTRIPDFGMGQKNVREGAGGWRWGYSGGGGVEKRERAKRGGRK